MASFESDGGSETMIPFYKKEYSINGIINKNRWYLLVVLLVLVFATGCGGKKTKIVVYPDKDINGGRPVFLVVKSVHSNDFRTDSYRDVSVAAYKSPADESIIGQTMVIPGEKSTLKVVTPEKKSIGVYCFFSNPDRWKLLLQPPLDSKYKIEIKENNIKVKEGFF